LQLAGTLPREGEVLMTVRFIGTDVFPYGPAPSDEAEALKTIEICGRTAYKSEDKITEDSARAFVLMLKKHGHLSVLEHSNAVLKIKSSEDSDNSLALQNLRRLNLNLVSTLKERHAYHRTQIINEPHAALLVSGNFRAWLETLQGSRKSEGACFELLQWGIQRFYPNLFGPPEQKTSSGDFRVSVANAEEQLMLLTENYASDLPIFIFKIICDRGITHEIVRHRVLSFTQESTRYVNYKNKGMTLILPEELEPYWNAATCDFREQNVLIEKWLNRAASIFAWYQEDIGRGRRPEIARDILPNLLKSEIFVSGRWSGWRHFISLRDSKHAHPRIRHIAQKIREFFMSIGLH
jgi:flavin-dependent thymidylate synthase